MDYRIDEKGKYYTEHISKQATPVVALVEAVLIRGDIHLTPGNRLKDELNGAEAFIAITDASVSDATTQRVLYKTQLLVVNKNKITWIHPSEQTI